MNDDEKLRAFEAQAEDAYAAMYDAPNSTAAAGCYSNAKEALYDAIGLARRLGKADVAAQLEARLNHIKAVFRSQFGT
jgi:hypothetical protein